MLLTNCIVSTIDYDVELLTIKGINKKLLLPLT